MKHMVPCSLQQTNLRLYSAPGNKDDSRITSIATYIRASTDTKEITHQRNATNDWLDEHDTDPDDIDQYADLGYSGSDPGREQFSELIDAIDTGEYECVVVGDFTIGTTRQYLPALFRMLRRRRDHCHYHRWLDL